MTIKQALNDIDNAIHKIAFIPAPNPQQGGQPQGGQQQGGGGMEQLLSQLPPEIADQLKQLPKEQQIAALQQMMQGGGQGGGQEQGGQGSDPAAQQGDPSQQAAQQGGQQAEKLQSSGPPTDLENSTITLRVRDLLDLVSGGNATKATLKVQEHIQKGQIRQQDLQNKVVEDKHKKELKAKQDQMAQQQQGQAMAGGGPNMMGGGGVY